MAQPTPFTLDDVRDPQRLMYLLRQMSLRLNNAETELEKRKRDDRNAAPAQSSSILDKMTLTKISSALSAGGAAPITLTDLRGESADPQKPKLLVFTSDPTTTPSLAATLYPVGTMATYNGGFYYVKAGNPHTWATVSLSAPTNMMTLDTAQTVAVGADKLWNGKNNFVGLVDFKPGSLPQFDSPSTFNQTVNVGTDLNQSLGQYKSSSQIRARGYHTGQSIPNATLTTLAFNGENYDVGGIHSGGTFTIPTAGTYAIFGQVEFGASAGGTIRSLNAFVNSTAVAAQKLAATFNAGTLIGLHCYTEWVCAAGDLVTFQVYQDSGGALVTGGSGGTGTFGGVRLIC